MEAVVRVLFAGSHAVVVGFVHAGGSRSHAQDTMVRWECDASGHVGGAFEGRVMSRRASGAEVGGSGGVSAERGRARCVGVRMTAGWLCWAVLGHVNTAVLGPRRRTQTTRTRSSTRRGRGGK